LEPSGDRRSLAVVGSSGDGISDALLAVIVGATTLLGAGVGGAITGIITLRAEDKRQRFAREREEREEARQREGDERERERALQQAARLVLEELGDNVELIREAVRLGYYWPGGRQLPMEVWTAYRSVLAADLSDEDWFGVTLAYESVNVQNLEVLRLQETQDLPLVDEQQRGLLRTVVLMILEGRKALARATGRSEGEGLWDQDERALVDSAVPREPDDND
jgi:hypothetical protein